MKKLLLLFVVLSVCACGREKTYVVGETAFCSGLDDSSNEPVYCVDDKNEPINGIVIEYYANGQVFREMTIRKGRENGIAREYYENGVLHVETNVVDGHADGRSRLYSESGKLYMELKWVDGNTSDIRLYDDSGRMISANIE